MANALRAIIAILIVSVSIDVITTFALTIRDGGCCYCSCWYHNYSLILLFVFL